MSALTVESVVPRTRKLPPAAVIPTMRPPSPVVSIGILTFNRKQKVLAAIRSACSQQSDDVEIVVVDNGSQDGTAEAIREHFPTVALVCLPRNLGAPGGRNHLFANCRGKYIVCLDDDGLMGDDVARKVVSVFESDEKLGIVAMRQRYTDELDTEQPDIRHERVPAGCFRAGLCALRRSMIEAIGGYPEEFFLFAEEPHLAIRALHAGYTIVAYDDITMWHPRIGSSFTTRWDYYRFRNSLLLVAELFPGLLMLKYLTLRTVSYFFVSLRRGTFALYAAALASTLRELPRILRTKTPCSREAIGTYFKLRDVTVPRD